jgi:hypothetical protein
MNSVKQVFLALFLLLASSASVAFTIRPADGLWGIVSEQNLAIGRGINLEVGGSILVVTIYGYNSQRLPTFYVGGGALTASNTAAVPLSEPAGGTCFGCAPTSGFGLSAPGTATFEFTSSTTGFVTLPGEARKAIVKGPITSQPPPVGLLGVWVFSYVTDTTLVTADVAVLSQRLASTTNGNGLVANSTGSIGCELQVQGVAAGYVLCVKLNSTGSTDRSMIARWWRDDMDGAWQFTTTSTARVFAAKRLIDENANEVVFKAAATRNANGDRLRDAIEALARSLASEAPGDFVRK